MSMERFGQKQASMALYDEDHQYHPLMVTAYMLAESLHEARIKRGSIVFADEMDDIKDDEGDEDQHGAYRSRPSLFIIQEFILVTNAAIRNFLVENNQPALFRNQSAEEVIVDGQRKLKSNRAVYSPYSDNHVELNTWYIHATAGIRSYPDLVNQYMLKALLLHEEPPFSIAELEEIATELNQPPKKNSPYALPFQNKTESNAQQAREHIESQTFDVDDLVLFQYIIRVLAQEYSLPAEMRLTIAEKLESNSLNLEVLFVTLFSLKKEPESWKPTYVAILWWLKDKPQVVLDLFRMGVRRSLWFPVDYKVKDFELNGQLFFSVTAKTMMQGNKVVSEKTVSLSKLKAKDASLLDLLSRMLDVPSVVEKDVQVKKEKQETPREKETVVKKLAEDYVNSLDSFCQKMKWPQPQYTPTMSGRAHDPIFSFTVSLQTPEGEMKTPTITHKKKMLAKQFAAKRMAKMLMEAGYYVQNTTVKRKEITIINGDYVSALHVLAEKKHLPLPSYTTLLEAGNDGRPFFACEVKVIAFGKEVFAKALHEDRKMAKQKSAEILFEKLIQMVEPVDE